MVEVENKTQRYDNHKDSGVEWLGEIPEHWDVLPLFALTKLKSIINNTDLELLSVYLDKGVIRFSDVTAKRTNVTSLDLSKYQLVEPGDFVLNNQQAWRGSVGVSTYKGIVSPAYIVLNLSEKIDPFFANYLFRDGSMVSQYLINSKGVGTIQRNLYWPSLRRTSISLPLLEEQTAIAQFLDDKTTKIDHAVSVKEKQIELLKERKQILIHRAVTRGLDDTVKLKDSGVEWIGEIPEHWDVKRLKFMTNLISEKILSSESELEYIGMENIESWTGKFTPSDSETEGLANYFSKGDVLFGKLRPYLAKVYLAESEGICSTEFLVYRTNEYIYNWYLNLVMLSFEFINLIDSSTYGSKMPRANSDFIGNQLIPIPPLSEQKEISEYIETSSQKIETAISLKQQEIEQLKEYKSSLINNVVTGKVKVS